MNRKANRSHKSSQWAHNVETTLIQRPDVESMLFQYFVSAGLFSSTIWQKTYQVCPVSLTHCRLNELSHTIYWKILIMPPTLINVGGHIASGLSVRSLRSFIHYVRLFVTLSGA